MSLLERAKSLKERVHLDIQNIFRKSLINKDRAFKKDFKQ